MAIKVGEPAPDFTLPDQHGHPTSLSALNGPVLIVFFPAAFTPVCSSELQVLRDASLPGATVLGISCDSPYALRAFAEAEALPFALLSDFWPHGEVAEAYGAFLRERGIAGRLSVLIDGEGIVRQAWHSPPSQPRDVADYQGAVAGLSRG